MTSCPVQRRTATSLDDCIEWQNATCVTGEVIWR